MEKNEILQELIDYYTKGNKRQFAFMIGMSPQAITAWLRRNTFDVDVLSTKCKNINPAYLLTGEGSMLLSEDNNTPYQAQKVSNNTADINELLAIAHALQEQSVNNAELLRKTQEQFDKVLNMFERVLALQEKINSNNTTI